MTKQLRCRDAALEYNAVVYLVLNRTCKHFDEFSNGCKGPDYNPHQGHVLVTVVIDQNASIIFRSLLETSIEDHLQT